MQENNISEIIGEIQRKMKAIKEKDDEILGLMQAADNCVVGGGEWTDKAEEEKYDKIWDQIFLKESEQWELRGQIKSLAVLNNLSYFSVNIYNQYRSKKQTQRFLKAIKEARIIMIDKPMGDDDLFILPPGSKEIAKTTKKVGDRLLRETTKIQLPTGKIIRYINYAPGRVWGHLFL